MIELENKFQKLDAHLSKFSKELKNYKKMPKARAILKENPTLIKYRF
jgi:AmiR/NasT family two-component response regulator